MKDKKEIDYTSARRETKFLDYKVINADESILNPGIKIPVPDHKVGKVTLMVESQIGLDRPKLNFYIVREGDLDEIIADINNVGNLPEGWDTISLYEHMTMGSDLDDLFSVATDDFHGDCYEALFGAGVIDESYKFKKEHLDRIPKQKIKWAKKQFNDNWLTVLMTDFTLSNFPYTSLVSYAARIFFNHYVTEDDFLVGYLWREMTMLIEQEPLAIKYSETRKSAGQGGGEASSTKKQMRLESLLSNLEELIAENPALNEISDIAVAELAVKRAKALSPDLWSQGQGQLENYLTEIASKQPYKKRYDAIFHKTA